MGNEFAQVAECNHDRPLDWHLLDHTNHAGIQKLIRDLNRLYRSLPALHERDCEAEGFEWIKVDDVECSVFAWLRKGRDPRSKCLVVVNFTPQVYRGYRIKVPLAGIWREILNTDATIYGGGNIGNNGAVTTIDNAHGSEVELVIPPLAAVFFVPE
jgi:1,4-alpha-glucan branching enzyme